MYVVHVALILIEIELRYIIIITSFFYHFSITILQFDSGLP